MVEIKNLLTITISVISCVFSYLQDSWQYKRTTDQLLNEYSSEEFSTAWINLLKIKKEATEKKKDYVEYFFEESAKRGPDEYLKEKKIRTVLYFAMRIHFGIDNSLFSRQFYLYFGDTFAKNFDNLVCPILKNEKSHHYDQFLVNDICKTMKKLTDKYDKEKFNKNKNIKIL
jgi:hypothetical protein